MIAHLKGILENKNIGNVVIDVSGVGYEVLISQATYEKLPSCGKEIKLHIVESVSMYAGGTTFYGFISEEERDIFVLLKDKIPGTGAKKSLDYLEKISKSLPDFRRAVMTKNAVLLTSIFGFTKKTAEKIIVSLKDKIHELEIHGKEKWSKLEETTPMSEAVEGLVALGYRESQSRDAVDKILASCPDEMQVEEIIKQALKHL